jgi:hypothetical protein
MKENKVVLMVGHVKTNNNLILRQRCENINVAIALLKAFNFRIFLSEISN